MNIVLATDNNYVQHCAITISSILRNNHDVAIYILTEDLSNDNKQILQDEVNAYSGTIDFIMIDKSVIDSLPMPSHSYLTHISRATYYRLLLPNIISHSVDKVIYLDCDLVVNSPLDELWNINIDEFAIAACKQIGGGADCRRLGIPVEYGYFNAGVLLINVKYWRDNNISKALIDFLFTHSKTIVFHDQDALNAVLYDRCIYLHQRWNMNAATYSKHYLSMTSYKGGDSYDKEIDEAMKYQSRPSILHYSSKIKPWNWKCTHPMVNLYYSYAMTTVHFNHLHKPSIVIKTIAHLREKTISFLIKIKHIISII